MEMTWNKPGEGPEKNDGKRDPWSGKPPQSDGPPELDEVLRKLRAQLGGLFGQQKKGGSSQGSGMSAKWERFSFGAVFAVIFALWFLSGIFIVDPSEQAVISRFGKYYETLGSGPHWIPRLVDTKKIINTEKIQKYDYSGLMLTKDANMVAAELNVQYRISNPRDYLFNLTSAKQSLEHATASALRQIIGQNTLDSVLTVDREKVRKGARDILVSTLEKYKSGLTVTDVSFQQAKAPDEVKEAFDDAIKAQEDEKRFQNQAEAYAKQVEPRAQGEAQRLLADAEAYKQQVVLHAQGEVARYLALLPYYQKAPGVTRDRLYIEAMENVLSQATKVIVDTKGGNMLYLPLDKLMPQIAQTSTSTSATGSNVSSQRALPASGYGDSQPPAEITTSESAEAQMKGGY